MPKLLGARDNERTENVSRLKREMIFFFSPLPIILFVEFNPGRIELIYLVRSLKNKLG